MKLARVCIALLLISPASLATWAAADCQQPQARYEDLSCASKALDKADQNLNEAYKALLAALEQGEREKLREAQRAWVQFRDADTAFSYLRSGEGGSLAGLVAVNHKLDLTAERARHLRAFSNGAQR